MDYKTACNTFEYNPNTGDILWKNSKLPAKNGTLAGTMKKETGYIQLFFNGKLYLAHRIAMLISYGYCPEEAVVDHINHRRDDNRLSNLRFSNAKDNAKNISLRNDNKTGHMGVVFHKPAKKYQANIAVDGKRIYLGLFETYSDSVFARKEAERKYGFHHNHGK